MIMIISLGNLWWFARKVLKREDIIQDEEKVVDLWELFGKLIIYPCAQHSAFFK